MFFCWKRLVEVGEVKKVVKVEKKPLSPHRHCEVRSNLQISRQTCVVRGVSCVEIASFLAMTHSFKLFRQIQWRCLRPGLSLQLLIPSPLVEAGTTFRGFRCYP
jgi:hypothetical protein